MKNEFLNEKMTVVECRQTKNYYYHYHLLLFQFQILIKISTHSTRFNKS